MFTPQHRNIRGFTFLELIVAIAVLGLLLGIGLPNLRTALQNSRMTSQANSIVAAFQLARTEAIKRSGAVTICPSANGSSCSNDWTEGWIVFEDGELAGESTVTVDNVLQIWSGMDGDVANNGDSPSFVRFVADGSIDRDAGVSFPATLQFQIPECTGNNNRDLDIGVTGRVIVERVPCA